MPTFKQGVGRGGSNKRYKDDECYRTGKGHFQKLRPILKQERRYCEKCGKDLLEATHYQWVIHHKDHDNTNQDPTNLMLLCKRCHQLTHECWKAFEGATTIPKGSRVQEDSKREAHL